MLPVIVRLMDVVIEVTRRGRRARPFGGAEGTTMGMRSRTFLLATTSLLAGAGAARAEDRAAPDLEPLLAEVRRLVGRHYPKAEFSHEGQAIRFQFNTRRFMVHELTRVGDEWQDAREEPGPQPGGIYCDMELREGRYSGPLGLPQTFDKRYFKLYHAAPYSRDLGRHLSVHLKYPGRASEEFLREFKRLTDQFETYVPDRARQPRAP
jgi:hypothetical protein